MMSVACRVLAAPSPSMLDYACMYVGAAFNGFAEDLHSKSVPPAD